MAKQAKEAKMNEQTAESGKTKIPLGIRPHTGIPKFPLNDFDQYQKESEMFSRVVEVAEFRGEFPYPRYKRINLIVEWHQVTAFAESLPPQERFRFFTIYAKTLNAIADYSKNESYRSNAKLASKFAAKLQEANTSKQPATDSHLTEPMSSPRQVSLAKELIEKDPKEDTTEESDREFSGRLRNQIPAHGELLLKLEVMEGNFERVRISKLSLEKMVWNQAASLYYLMWWVTVEWKSDGEILNIPLPLFLSLCRKEAYPQITSTIIRTLWEDSKVPGDAFLILNFNLVSIACSSDDNVAIAWGVFGRIDRALHLKGMWPSFDGDWTSMKRFANMLAQHRRINYFGYCYLNFPWTRRELIEALRAEPLPPEIEAKGFVEACAELWLRVSHSNDKEVQAVLRDILLNSAKRFGVYPSTHFEREAIETLAMLFRDDRQAFLNYVIKTAKQEISGMHITKVPKGMRIEPFHSDLVRAKRSEDWERGKIEKTIKWCEIELEYAVARKADLQSSSQTFGASQILPTDAHQNVKIENTSATPKSGSLEADESDSLEPIGDCNYTVAHIAKLTKMSHSGVCDALKRNRKIRGVRIKFTRNEGKKAPYQIADRSYQALERKLRPLD